MSKSIKLLDNIFIDTKGITHNRELLSNYLNTMKNTVTTVNNTVAAIGTVISSGAEVTNTAKQSQSNDICSIIIPAGVWLVIGHWRYEDQNLSSYTALENITISLADSRYDDQGWVNTTVIGIQSSNNSTRVYLNLWPRNKTVSVKSHIQAIRIK